MDKDRFIGERRGLRIIRILTGLTLWTGLLGTPAILTGASGPSMAAAFASLGFLAACSDQIQHRIRGFVPYSLACLGMGALTLLGTCLSLPKIWIGSVLLCLVQILWLYMARAGRYRLYAPRPGHLLLPLLIWLLGITQESRPLKGLALLTEISLALLYMAFQNQKSLAHTYTAASEKARVPYQKIGLLNTGLLVLFLLGAGLVCLFLCALYTGDEVFLLIPRAGMALFGLFLGGILWLAVHLFPGAAGDGAAAGADTGMEGLQGARELFPWLHVLWAVLERVLGLVLILFLIWIAYALFASFYYDFRTADPETGDLRRRVSAPERSKRGTLRSRILFSLGPGARIRRSYRDLILQRTKKGAIRPSDTPAILEKKAAGKDPAGPWETIHGLYEKARYGGGKATREDLSAFLEAKKELAPGAGSERSPAGE